MEKDQSLLPTWTEFRELFRSGRNQFIIAGVVATLSLLFEAVRNWLWNCYQRLSLIVVANLPIPCWVLLGLIVVIIAETTYISFLLSKGSQTGFKEIYNRFSGEEREVINLLAKSDFGLSEWELTQEIVLSPQHYLWLIDQLTKKYKLVNRSEPKSGGAYWCLNERGRALAAELKLFANQAHP